MQNRFLFLLYLRLSAFVCVQFLFFTACAPTPTPMPIPTPTPRAIQTPAATPTPAPTPIEFWYSAASGDQSAALDALAQKFNATQTRVRVTARNVGASSDLLKRLASTAPDIALLHPSDIAAQIKTGAIIPLDDLMKDAQFALDATDIYPAFIDRYPQFNNRVYSLAPARFMQVLYYNSALLGGPSTSLRVDLSTPPETWDEFTKTCTAIAKPPDVFCWLADISAFDFAAQVYARGGELVSADGKTAAFNYKPALDALNMLKDHLTKGYAVPTKIAFQEPLDLAKGKLAFAFDTSAGLPLYERTLKSADKPINWSIALYPRANANSNRVALVYGEAFAVFKSSLEQERAAFAFVKWLMDAAQIAEYARATGAFPAREAARGALAEYNAANPRYALALDWLKFARTEPNVVGWGNVRVALADSIAAVVNGKMTPQDALKDAEKKANSLLVGQ